MVVMVLLGAACGGSDDDADDASSAPAGTEQAASPDGGAGSETTEPADESVGPEDAPAGGIDAASMPATGDAQFEVEGATYEFAAADAAQGPAYSCSVGPSEIVAEFQLSPGALLVQVNNPDGEQWLGNITISPPGSDRIYFSEPGFNGTFVVAGTMARYDGDFFWRTSDNPASNEEAGVGTVRLSC